MRIDFHSHVSDPLDYACRLIRKALAAQCKLIVCLQDQQQLTQLDALLWSFSATDFLPHVVLNHDNQTIARHTPVWLVLADDKAVSNLMVELSNQHGEILVNLSEVVPVYVGHCQRLIEIVWKNEQATQAGRQRYRLYQQQGHQLNHINAK